MTEFASPQRRPLHLWLVGIVSLFWNTFGAVDFTMTQMRVPAWLANFPPAMIILLDEFPVWSVIAWGFGVWGAVAGSVLLLLKSRLAVPAFAVSLAGLAATAAYQATIEWPAELATPAMTVLNLVIWAVAIGLLVYAWLMKGRGLLR